jgi:hypothetical protein
MNIETSRRALLAGLAIAPIAVAAPAAAVARFAQERRAWDAAFAVYERTRWEFQRLCNVHSVLEEQLPGRVDRYFDDLGLYIGAKREDAVSAARMALWRREFGTTGLILYPADARIQQESRQAEILIEAERTADEFMAYQEHCERERERLGVDDADDAASIYGETHYFPARDALMDVPAPDEAALLIKLMVALESLSDAHADSTLGDARRLVGWRA